MRAAWICAPFLLGCGAITHEPAPLGTDAGDDAAMVLDDAGMPPPACKNLQCQQVICKDGSTTRVSGVVYAPNGTLPLYNVLVYVPNAPLDPLSDTLACPCESISGSPISAAVSDAHGRFVLKDVPVGTNIPVVVQTEKWRRQVVLPQVDACVDNPIPGVALPRNHLEGHLPRIAVTTGCDPVACVLHKVGIDSAEIGVSSSGPERVVFYEGSSGSAPIGAASASTLWNDAKELAKFDDVLLASECADHAETKTNPGVVKAYADAGGALFLTGSQAVWPSTLVTAWSGTAMWGSNVTASAPYSVVVTFPRGKALADWLIGPEVRGSTTYAQLPVTSAGAHAGAVDSKIATAWVTAMGGATTVLSFSTPLNVNPNLQCGRVKYFDFSSSGTVDASFPSGCTGPLTPEEKVLAFHLFEMRGCIQNDTLPLSAPQK